MSDNKTKTVELPTDLVRRLKIAMEGTGRSFDEEVVYCLNDHLRRGVEQGIYSAISGLQGRVLKEIQFQLLLMELCQHVSTMTGKKISSNDMMIYFRKMYRISELKDGRLLIELV